MTNSLGGRSISRRSLLLAAAGTVGTASLAASGVLAERAPAADGGEPAHRVEFHGPHQAGIATPAQDRLVFAAFDLTTRRRAELADLLRVWTTAAEAMCIGNLVPGPDDRSSASPADTGEVDGLSPSHLTTTIGFGPTLFDHRFGLADRKPARLADLPPLPGDALDPAHCGGDLVVQACADDPQVAFHAVRNLARLGTGVAVLRWMQLGFGRTSSTGGAQATPRNLMGFKDGTRNIRGDDEAAMSAHVWVGAQEPQAWLRGGSYLVARRIRMHVEAWDREKLAEQQDVFGRYKRSGAPLAGSAEFDTPDLAARDGSGRLVIPPDAHIRLASPQANGGVRILRRGYSYTDGVDSATGELDAGLFFLSYQKDPARFIALQRKLGAQDALNEYVTHTGSAVFACPSGIDRGGHWGDRLLA